MQTLPRPAHFLTWDCDHCHQPSDQWDWSLSLRPEDGDDAPVLCTMCAALLLASPKQQDALCQSLQDTNRRVRRHVGLPYGTLIVCREEFGNRNDRGHPRFPGLLYGVVVDTWDSVWPDDEWVEWFDGGVLLFLGGFVFAGNDSKGRHIPAGWLILRSLERPADEPLCIPIPTDFSPTDDQRKHWEQARGAFFELRDRRGRPPSSGRFETAVDFERAVVAAIAALCRQKRKITQDAVGAYLIAKRGRNATTGQRAGESPSDPGRQFREWCSAFDLEPRALIQRATLSCDGGE